MRRTCLVAIALLASSVAAQSLLQDIDPTRAATSMGFDPQAGVVHQGLLFFSAARYDVGYRLWVTDGTASGTRLVSTAPGLSGPSQFVSAGPFCFFHAGGRIWRSDGTPNGTVPLTPERNFGADSSASIGGRALFTQRATNGVDLWSTDGTPAGTFILRNASIIGPLVVSGPWVWFRSYESAYGGEIWRTDGTAAGTTVLDVLPGPASSNAAELCADGAGGLWFSADDGP